MDQPKTVVRFPFVLGQRVVSSDLRLVDVRVKQVRSVTLTMAVRAADSARPQYRIGYEDGTGSELLYESAIRTIEQARADLIEQFAAAIKELDEAAIENQKLFNSLKEESHE